MAFARLFLVFLIGLFLHPGRDRVVNASPLSFLGRGHSSATSTACTTISSSHAFPLSTHNPEPTSSARVSVSSSTTLATSSGPRATTTTYPPLPTITVNPKLPPAQPPAPGSYVLSKDFVITDEPITRVFNWTIDWRTGSPDGYVRPVIAINGQTPGPLIEANEGDTLVINVWNNMPNGTTIHWHGQQQNHTPFMDGVVGISQCPIPANGYFQYKFQAQSFGVCVFMDSLVLTATTSYWYHSHFSTQYTDGLYGPLIIHSPNDPLKRGKDFDEEQVLFYADWYHDQANEIAAGLQSSGAVGYDGHGGVAPSPYSGVMNGNGVYNCNDAPAGEQCNQKTPPVIQVEQNKAYRFRLINGGSHAEMQFSVDEHSLSVIEADDTGVEPYQVHRVPFHNGQRYSVIVNTTVGKPGDTYWIRSKMNTNCFAYIEPSLNATTFGILQYVDNSNTTEPVQTPTTPDWGDVLGSECIDLADSALVPLIKIDAPTVVDQRRHYNSSFNTLTVQGQNYSRFFVDGVTAVDYEYIPLLETVHDDRPVNATNIAPLYLTGTTADIIINNLDPFLDHPYHLHGFTFFLVGRCNGTLNEEQAKSIDFNTTNPLRRDTTAIGRSSWAVLRVVNDLPGVWPLHCHIAWHLAEGFLGAVVAQPSYLHNQLQIPKAVQDLCYDIPPGETPWNATQIGARKRGRFPWHGLPSLSAT